MPTDNAIVVSGNVLGVERSFTPTELGLSAVNIKANPSSAASNKIDLQGFNRFMLTIVVDNTGGGTTGLYKLSIDLYDEQDVNIFTTFDLFTGGTLKTDNTVTFVWGVGGAKMNGTGNITGGNADDIVQFGSRTNLTLTNTEVLNGTSVAVTCYLRAKT